MYAGVVIQLGVPEMPSPSRSSGVGERKDHGIRHGIQKAQTGIGGGQQTGRRSSGRHLFRREPWQCAVLQLRSTLIQVLIARAIVLPETCKRRERMATSIAGVTTSAGGRNEQGSQSGGRGEDLVVEGHVTGQEPRLFIRGKPIHRAVQQLILSRGIGHQLVATDKHERHEEENETHGDLN